MIRCLEERHDVPSEKFADTDANECGAGATPMAVLPLPGPRSLGGNKKMGTIFSTHYSHW